MFLKETIQDSARSGNTVELEVGRSSYLAGENLIYLVVDGKTLILDETIGRKFYEAVSSLGSYLGYETTTNT
jgi:hypothetical protein